MHRIAYLRGGPEDQSGPEMADAAMHVIQVLLTRQQDLSVEFVEVEAGTHCYPIFGTSLPSASLKKVIDLAVVFKAPMASSRVGESVSMILRKELMAFASINEMRSYPGVPTALRPDIDVVLIRENSEGLFLGHSAQPYPGMTVDLRVMTTNAAKRIAHLGFELARRRRHRVVVCAFPVLVPSDKTFVDACVEVAHEYPDVELLVRKVDSVAGTVVTDASQYDVVIAPNEWGAILTDLFGAACGSVALGGRGNVGNKTGCFEPIHGTAPGKAGKGTVNPVSQILAAKIMFEWLGAQTGDQAALRAAVSIGESVRRVLTSGNVLTPDLGGSATTSAMVDAISNEIIEISAIGIR